MSDRHVTLLKWFAVLASAGAILAVPVPDGITPASWRLFAVFAATIVGSVARPVPSGAVVLLGVTALVISGAVPIEKALGGYGDPVAWICIPAFFLSRAMMKTGIGRRIALLFIRAIGHSSLGVGYALAGTDLLLATAIPSNGARSGGIIFPLARSIAETFDSRPGPTARRLGAFLLVFAYQCDVIICAMFLTGQAGNLLIARFARETAGVELTYARWITASIVPGLVSLVVVPLVIYRLFPPEIRRTPEAAAFARNELTAMGPMSKPEKLMLGVFVLVLVLWATSTWHGIHYTAVGLLGVCVLLVANVLDWEDLMSERSAWDVFIWYGGVLMMAGELAKTGITDRFAAAAAAYTTGWAWGAALGVLLLVYFYAHYAFASISAHATAMYIPFLALLTAAGAPPYLVALSLAFVSNLSASLTHYGTTPAPIYFGAGYVTQRSWWLIGLMVSVPNIIIWTVVGAIWWKVLGLW